MVIRHHVKAFKNMHLNHYEMLIFSPQKILLVLNQRMDNHVGSPNHPNFKTFPEVNGGVFGLHWTLQTERLIIRALELVPLFTSLGFDQDQAFVRHALFESLMFDNLTQQVESMDRYCRHGWDCKRNSCRTGCYIIHQRLCLSEGVNHKFKNTSNSLYITPAEKTHLTQCFNQLNRLSERLTWYSRSYHRINKQNKGKFKKKKAVLEK